MINKSLLKSAVPIIIVALLFLISSRIADFYGDDLIETISIRGVGGIAAYIFVTAAATIVAPLSTIPFIPIASGIWGPLVAAIANIIGWSVGALGAFYISRKYGRTFVEKIISKEKLESIERRLPQKNIFWTIILLRMTVPVDVLSYILGLFKNVTWKLYTATLVGIIPFAFVFSYAGTLSARFQIFLVILIAPILFLIWRKRV
ncbi:MAG: VTT domain-containing protein [Patescibacteria group bacterium]